MSHLKSSNLFFRSLARFWEKLIILCSYCYPKEACQLGLLAIWLRCTVLCVLGIKIGLVHHSARWSYGKLISLAMDHINVVADSPFGYVLGVLGGVVGALFGICKVVLLPPCRGWLIRMWKPGRARFKKRVYFLVFFGEKRGIDFYSGVSSSRLWRA